jgi:hypothetical protein
VLDVYKQKRVDKRKVFASNYTRLRGLEEVLGGPGGLGGEAAAAAAAAAAAGGGGSLEQ